MAEGGRLTRNGDRCSCEQRHNRRNGSQARRPAPHGMEISGDERVLAVSGGTE
jgi:hypothetical protein